MKMKVKGLKKACGDLNGYRKFTRHVMYDKSDNTVWVDVFYDCNSWNEYHDHDIICVMRISNLHYDYITQKEMIKEIEIAVAIKEIEDGK
jgi:hypothetical protein